MNAALAVAQFSLADMQAMLVYCETLAFLLLHHRSRASKWYPKRDVAKAIADSKPSLWLHAKSLFSRRSRRELEAGEAAAARATRVLTR